MRTTDVTPSQRHTKLEVWRKTHQVELVECWINGKSSLVSIEVVGTKWTIIE